MLSVEDMAAKNNFSDEEMRYINALLRAFENNNVNSSFYSLYGYSDSAICLSKRKNGYEIYDGERGVKFDSIEVSNIQDACNIVIARVADKATLSKIRRDFSSLLRLSTEPRVEIPMTHIRPSWRAAALARRTPSIGGMRAYRKSNASFKYVGRKKRTKKAKNKKIIK